MYARKMNMTMVSFFSCTKYEVLMTQLDRDTPYRQIGILEKNQKNGQEGEQLIQTMQ